MPRIETLAQRKHRSQNRRNFHEALGFNLRRRQFSEDEQWLTLKVAHMTNCDGWTVVQALDDAAWDSWNAYAAIKKKQWGSMGFRD
jgi:hypothetical protein